MQVSFSLAARDRLFAKAIRRIRPLFDSLLLELKSIELTGPIHEMILIGITDEKDADYFELVPNKEGCFQVLSGFRSDLARQPNDAPLVCSLFAIIEKGVLAAPFSKPDRQQVEQVFQRRRKDFIPDSH